MDEVNEAGRRECRQGRLLLSKIPEDETLVDIWLLRLVTDVSGSSVMRYRTISGWSGGQPNYGITYSSVCQG